MKADKLTVEKVFNHPERLEAPLFQRPYVWKEDTNWGPLWESIKSVADRRLQKKDGHPHFLGAVVLDQLKTPTGNSQRRQIIDGQQRLTTLQLALAAVRDLAKQGKQDKYAEAFRQLTDNYVPLSNDPNDVFKVWPTNADRQIFRQVMQAQGGDAVRKLADDCPNKDELIPGAYLYFHRQFGEWLKSAAAGGATDAIDVLYAALKDDLLVVCIDLEQNDDAQEIFETLNALGTPLLPADLVKNFLFRRAEANHEDSEKLYSRYWQVFDSAKSYWREEVRQGRLKRARLDLFLNHYLTFLTADEVVISQMFNTYRDHVESLDGRPVAVHMEQFRAYADTYHSFDEFPEDSREGHFFYLLREMDTTTAYPLLLELFKRYVSIGKTPEMREVLTDLESYLIRRMICELTTKNYNRFFAKLVSTLRDNDDDFSPTAIRKLLLSEKEDLGRWPDDAEFKEHWVTIEFYKRIKKSRQRMVLEALEAQLHTGKVEKVKFEEKLTVEHLLPVEWEKWWPLVIKESVGGAQEQAIERRNAALHRIGNLTLLTKTLNPSISNGPWLKKRDAILKHSALNLNRPFLQIDAWDEDRIDQRSKELFNEVVKIWPYPSCE